MSSKCLKANIIPAAAALAIALGNSSPLWAQTPAVRDVSSDLHLAMMDDMDEMAKMKEKGGMGDKKMKGNMPADAPMPNADAGVQDAT